MAYVTKLNFWICALYYKFFQDIRDNIRYHSPLPIYSFNNECLSYVKDADLGIRLGNQSH
jgi:hypothetical protein